MVSRVSPAQKRTGLPFDLPEYVRMAEFVHQLNFFQHVWPIRRQLVHLQDHHLTRHFVGNLETGYTDVEHNFLRRRETLCVISSNP